MKQESIDFEKIKIVYGALMDGLEKLPIEIILDRNCALWIMAALIDMMVIIAKATKLDQETLINAVKDTYAMESEPKCLN
jgi:hypothetical protein